MERWIVEINGEPRAIPPLPSVAQLLEYLAIAPERIAVEVNHRIVRRKDWTSATLQDRDKVEIVQFVGGG